MIKALRTVGRYIMLMGRVFSRPERMRVFFRQYLHEMEQLGVNSIGIVLLISFFIGAVITIQIKLNIESAWMPRWTVGYVTREIMLLEFSSSIMCLILAAGYATDRRARNHGSQLCKLSDSAENSGHGHRHSRVGHIQHLRRYYRSLLYLLVYRHHECRRSGIRIAIYVCRVVCLGGSHQIAFLRVYHCQRVRFLRIYGRRRLNCRREGFDRRCGIQQCVGVVCRFDIN